MEALKLLENYKKRVDVNLKKYFQKKIHQAGKSDPLAKEAIKMIADFTMSGGKRIRPAMVYYAYLAAGGKNENRIIEASMCMELTHSFLLIHDDIIDKDEKRHGVSTIHERYKKIGKRWASTKDSEHFGNSMAMLAGDMSAAMANEVLFNCTFPSDIIVRALDKLQLIVYTIVPGEMLDVMLEIQGRASEKDVLKMYEGKTSSYSFEGPLHLGTVLAGVDNPKMLKNYSQYSAPLGKAFQIRDDVLGIYGKEKKIGKPIGSDVIEGKQTLLVVKALELGTRQQRGRIKKYLGKKDLTSRELEEFRMIIKESGSLEYCQNLADNFVKEAIFAINKIDFKNEEAKQFLVGLAEYMVKREI
jgi:geranylgeranyl diphosphate synthase type I